MPDHIIELPQRFARLSWDENTNALTGDTVVTLRNAGTAASSNVETDVDTDWLLAELDFPDDEFTSGTVELAINAEKMRLLGNGDYTATVTVTDGDLSESMLVEVTVVNKANVGPYQADLPNIRGDDVVTIEAEAYDLGGQNVAYSAANSGSSPENYRSDQTGVHIDKSGAQYFLVDRENVEWFNYTVNVADDGYYRLQYRLRSFDSTLEMAFDVDGSPMTAIQPSNSSGGWITADASLIELTRGVHVFTITLNADFPLLNSDRAVDFDWFRLSPGDGSFPFTHAAPVLSMFGKTKVEAELYDRGGDGVAYDYWPANTSGTFREEENVVVTGGGSSPLAMVGSYGNIVRYTINVQTAGTYNVDFQVQNPFGSGTAGTFTLLEGSSSIISPNSLEITASTAFHATSATAYFTEGLHTVAFHCLSEAPNDLTGYVDWMEFAPINLMLHGPDAPPTPYSKPEKDQITHVGAAFAINAPGHVTSLKFYLNADEFDSTESQQAKHVVKLWRVASSTGTSNIVFTPTSSTSPLASEERDWDEVTEGWNEVEVETALLEPGLYIVSVNVMSHLSVNPITTYTTTSNVTIPGVAPPATPSVLTLVAGSYSDTGNVFPAKVAASPYPTVHYWLDVAFSPKY